MSLELDVGRRRIEISRPDKLLFPDGITKADLARYYAEVAEAMLPHVSGRPLNLERYPDGIDGHGIFQQHASSHFPDWIARARVPKRGGSVEHVVANDAATLVYLANQACITLHAWTSRADHLDRPDRLVIDLDPSGDDPPRIRRAAVTFAELLRELGLEPWPMTTGSRGYHLVVPLQRRANFDVVRTFARDLAELAVRRHPKAFTTEQRKAKRAGLILVDVLRNAYAHTSVAPYSVRARPGAPVAAPLHPDELADRRLRADRWTLRNIRTRLGADGDPWKDIAKHAGGLGAAKRQLDAALAAD